MAPGTIVYDGEAPTTPVAIHLFDFDDEHLEEHPLDRADATREYKQRPTVTWLDVDGVHNEEIVQTIGRIFDIHALTLEDIVNTNQRAKLEEYPEYVYVVLQMLHYDHETCRLESEQVSLILGDTYVISFQEAKEGDVFEPIRTRLREHRGRIRRSGADYLAYALIDLIVDYYLEVLDGLGRHIEELEDEVAENPEPEHLQRINDLREYVRLLRRSIWPVRDVTSRLERMELPFMSSETSVYFRDVYDHTLNTMELIDSSREMLSSMIDLYQSTVSFRMNEVMKVLTIIATFFLPLGFLAGLYGMNFNPEVSPLNMPELGWYYGYPYALALMAIVAVGMFIYFRRKGWL